MASVYLLYLSFPEDIKSTALFMGFTARKINKLRERQRAKY